MSLFNAVEIEINSNCNFTCSYCPNSFAQRIEQGQMTAQLYERIINQLSELKFQGRISYDFYNEPTLSPNLINFIVWAKKELPLCTVDLYSNGTQIDIDLFWTLNNAGVDHFIITKHENINQYIFDETYSKLSNDQLKKVIYRKFSDINLTNRGGVVKHIQPQSNTALLPCHIPNMMLTITNKGNIVPCFEDFYQKNVMGNILETPLIEIWNSEKYVTFRKKLFLGLRHKFDACNTCSRTEVTQE